MARRPVNRIERRDFRRGVQQLLVMGARPRGFGDLYHQALRIPLWAVLPCLGGLYLTINLLFACLYLLDPHGVSNLKAGDFLDAFFFSVQTLSTVGYGAMAPVSLYANVLVTIECFLGLVLIALNTGLIFAHISKPTARVLFSEVATVTLFDGVPTLMFRAINERSNQILEADVTLNLARQSITAEGRNWRRFQEMRVTRQRSPLFALSWTIMHPVDEASPLFGATPQSLQNEGAEIIVVISGVDDIFAQRIHARHTYGAEDVLWGKEFENVLHLGDDGRWVLDYRSFHAVRDEDATTPD